MLQTIINLSVVEKESNLVVFSKENSHPQDVIPACQLFGRAGRSVVIDFIEKEIDVPETPFKN